MPCYYPLDAWQKRPGSKPVFKYVSGAVKLTLPCGQCIGCRLRRSAEWALRCVHEAQLYTDNSFVTLTYRDNPFSLRKSDFQKFLKRLRKAIAPVSLRYFMCGEYGERFDRPHYHACFFGWRPSDLEPIFVRDGIVLYKSQFLSEVWGHGFVTVGDVTFESAAYVARYINKKINGDAAQEHYELLDTSTGEVFDRLPEYCDMSRGTRPRDGRPSTGGIGKAFYERFKSDFDKDFITHDARRLRPPRYYDRLLHAADPDALVQRKSVRKVKALQHADDNVPARLDVKRQIKERKLKLLKRGFYYED